MHFDKGYTNNSDNRSLTRNCYILYNNVIVDNLSYCSHNENTALHVSEKLKLIELILSKFLRNIWILDLDSNENIMN